MENERPLTGCRILVVEDEFFIARDLRTLLETTGAEIIGPFGNLDDALGQVRRDGFEAAVLDIGLQGAECYGVADELARHGVPFVFTNAYDEEGIPSRFADVHLWQKPFSGQALVEDIRRLCEGLRSRRRINGSIQPSLT